MSELSSNILMQTGEFAVVEIGADSRVVRSEGFVAEEIRPGADAFDAMPYLVGLEPVMFGPAGETAAAMSLSNISLINPADGDSPGQTVSVRILPVADSGTATVLLQDVTAKAALERDVMQARNQLALAQQEIEAARDAARQAESLKERFVSFVAHDLRAPLTSTVEVLSAIANDAALRSPTGETDTWDHLISAQIDVCNKALDLVQRLVDLNRARSTALAPEITSVDLNDILAEAMADTLSTAERKNVRIEFAPGKPVMARADTLLSVTVVSNLILNAVKFSQPGDAVRLSAVAGNIPAIQVVDAGAGIEPTVLERLFDMSANVTTRGTGNEKGYGLGLLLCKEYMESQKGKIMLRSEPGQGTTAILDFAPDI